MPETVTITIADLDPDDPNLEWGDVVAVLSEPGLAVTGFDWRRRVLAGLVRQIEAQTTPQPAEPTGLGAVIRDGAGDHLGRMARPTSDGACWETVEGVHRIFMWDEIPTPITVLFPGVTL